MHETLEPVSIEDLRASLGWIELGNLDEAAAVLDKFPAVLQEHPDILQTRFFVLASAERWEKALAIAEQLLREAPERSISWITWGYSMASLGRAGEAYAKIEPVVEKFPDDHSIRRTMGVLASKLRKPEDSAKWFRAAIDAYGASHVACLWHQMARDKFATAD